MPTGFYSYSAFSIAVHFCVGIASWFFGICVAMTNRKSRDQARTPSDLGLLCAADAAIAGYYIATSQHTSCKLRVSIGSPCFLSEHRNRYSLGRLINPQGFGRCRRPQRVV